MKHYTIHHNVRIDRKVEEDLQVVKTELVDQIEGLKGLVLVGGFSRGEGSVLLDGKSVKPLNDYDVVLIGNGAIQTTERKEYGRLLSEKLGIRYVDLIPRSEDNLHRLRPTMFNYDLKYGGHIFYGDSELLDRIPPMDSSRIPLVEGKILLMNRLICLLECFSQDFQQRNPTEDEKFFLAYQCAKVILGCCDALLVLKHRYHHHCVERAKRFGNLFPDRVELLDMVERATRFKLRPHREIRFDAVAHWFTTREIYLGTCLQFLSHLHGRRFSSFTEYFRFHEKNWRVLLKRGLYNLVKRSRNYETKLHLELCQMHLLDAFTQKAVEVSSLRSARQNLNRVTGKNYSDHSWEALRKEFLETWFDIYH